MAKKFYGVKVGLVPGIYTSWADVQAQINGYSGAIYRGFSSREQAEKYMDGIDDLLIESSNEGTQTKISNFNIETHIYTDGSEMEGNVGFGIVVLKGSEVIMKDCGRFTGKNEFTSQANVAGEIYAVIRAIQLIKANDFRNVCFYHDYLGISKWISGEWEAKNSLTKRYIEYFNEQMNGVNYTFKYVPAHSGEKYNKEADRLARLGTSL